MASTPTAEEMAICLCAQSMYESASTDRRWCIWCIEAGFYERHYGKRNSFVGEDSPETIWRQECGQRCGQSADSSMDRNVDNVHSISFGE